MSKTARHLLLCLALAACGSESKSHDQDRDHESVVDAGDVGDAQPDAGEVGDVAPDAGQSPENRADAGGLPEQPEDGSFVSDPTGGGWIAFDGTNSGGYTMGIDPAVELDGKPVAGVRSTLDTLTTNDYGTWMSGVRAGEAKKLLEQRVRMSAQVKSDAVEELAGLWMRVDGETDPVTGRPKLLGFDNMGARPIVGTTDWTKYEIVLDVPAPTTGIVFGLLIAGKGSAWLGPVTFEVVDASVPVTAELPPGF
jgi:hypothetical protein